MDNNYHQSDPTSEMVIHSDTFLNTMFLMIFTLTILMVMQTGTSQIVGGGFIQNGYGNNMYGSKTAYFWKHPPQATKPRNNLMKVQFEGQTCSAIHVNIISRHGARYTSVKDMRAFTSLHDKIKAALGNQSFSFLQQWKNEYPEEKGDMLSWLGKREMDYLGGTYAMQLEDLLARGINGSTFNDALVKFGVTSRIRTQESAISFRNAMAKQVLLKNDTSTAVPIRDNILRFYDNCAKYEEATATNPEMVKFQKGPEMKMVLDDIARKLQLNTTLTVDDVKMMWRLCATDLAIRNISSWCTVMNDVQRDILEYENDIEDYYGRLYGHPVTGQMACPLTRDIFTEIDSVIAAYDRGYNQTVGVFQFGHSDTLIDFAANMGFFNDNITFRADNFQQLRSRTFNNANVAHFSTHFAFILYNCGGSGQGNYAIRLIFNEEPLQFPACKSDICRYDTVRRSYAPSIDHCDWAGVCHVNQPGVPVGK